ncbi:MAG: ComF family protein [Candidatus Omnitrophica bacterium]|nr:ComF family protein [Candidatus Omnitrophota bacterium]
MWQALKQGLTDIFYPKVCLTCGDSLSRKPAKDQFVCLECWGKIKINTPPFCHFCGRKLDRIRIAKHLCRACLKKHVSFDRAFCPCEYSGVLKDLIHAFKYQGKDYLGEPLSTLMINHIKEYNLPIQYLDAIVPVPLHSAKLREREFNQAAVLSHCIGKAFNKQVADQVLIRNRPTKTQTDLTPCERTENVRESFSVVHQDAIRQKHLLLVDDVLTTAATSSEAAGALKRAGAGMVFVLALAN